NQTRRTKGSDGGEEGEAEEWAEAATAGIEAQQLELVELERAGDFQLDRRIDRPFAMRRPAEDAVEKLRRRGERHNIRRLVPLHDVADRGIEELPVVGHIRDIGFVADSNHRDDKRRAV